ncbi:MAG: hypothetical protein JOZ41_11345 [Chloroflexi bacterium]|nr:hypothetical protein [Chloroflexota bacterium]
MKQQAQQTAGQAVDQAREQATSLAAGQKDRTADSLRGIARALRQTDQQIEGKDGGLATELTVRAAEQVECLAGYLENHDLGQIRGEAEDLARRRPALFLGGAFALGLLASRFLKSSPPDAGGRSVTGQRLHDTSRVHEVAHDICPAPPPVQDDVPEMTREDDGTSA